MGNVNRAVSSFPIFPGSAAGAAALRPLQNHSPTLPTPSISDRLKYKGDMVMKPPHFMELRLGVSFMKPPHFMEVKFGVSFMKPPHVMELRIGVSFMKPPHFTG